MSDALRSRQALSRRCVSVSWGRYSSWGAREGLQEGVALLGLAMKGWHLRVG